MVPQRTTIIRRKTDFLNRRFWQGGVRNQGEVAMRRPDGDNKPRQDAEDKLARDGGLTPGSLESEGHYG